MFERLKCKLITKSPIHIGSHEQQITRYEFVTKDNYIYPVFEEKLAQFLHKRDLIADYCAEIERLGNKFVMSDFLEKRGIYPTKEELQKLSAGREIRVIGDINQIQEYKPLIRDAFNNPFIPGSSIKGVLRTAVLYKTLKSLKEQNPSLFKREIEEPIERKLNEDIEGKNKKEFFNWAEDRYLRGFNLFGKRQQPNTDWFKIFKISDCYCSEKIGTVIIPVYILKKEITWVYKTESEGQKTRLWLECIPAGTTLDFEIVLDQTLVKDFERENPNIKLPRNIHQLLEILIEWSRDIIEFEKKFFSNHAIKIWYEKNPCNFRIGAGSGMISSTILMLLDESLRVKIRNYAGGVNPSQIAPKSRKITEREGASTPLGWCLLTLEN